MARFPRSVVSLGLLVAGSALAAGMQVAPGKWEIKSTVQNPMGEQTETTSACYKQSELTPEQLTSKAQNCTFDSIEVSANSLSWRMACTAAPGSKMTGVGHYTSNGETMAGSVTMEGDFGGNKMKFDTKFTGRRIGDC